MRFNNISEAIKYVREMDEGATVAIGNQEVWHGSDGSILIDPVFDGDEDVEYTLIGTVAETLY